MTTTRTTRAIPEKLAARLPELRRQIEQELPDLIERDRCMEQAAQEETLWGQLRRAVHESRRSLDAIAADAGTPVLELCDFLEGARTTRSEVLDRIGLAIGASVPITSKKRYRQEAA